MYQNAGLILVFLRFFQARDVLKVGAVLTVVEGLLILMLVTLYWPLIGLSWQTTPSAQVQVIASEAADVPEIWPLHCSTLLRVFNSRYTTPMAPKLFTSSVPKEILLHRLALSMLLSLLLAILASSPPHSISHVGTGHIQQALHTSGIQVDTAQINKK